MTTTNRWAAPQDVDDVTVAFPAKVCGTLLPPQTEIPREFYDRRNEWARITSQWFFKGLDGRFIPKTGIDARRAVRHLSACMRSFEPKHEHKEAGVAYLLSLWFDRYEAVAR